MFTCKNYSSEVHLFELQKYRNTGKDFKEKSRYINYILAGMLYILLIILKLLHKSERVKCITETTPANGYLANQFNQQSTQAHCII